MQVTSEFSTKNGESSFPRISRAKASGPAEETTNSIRKSVQGLRHQRREEEQTCIERFVLDTECDANAVFFFSVFQHSHHYLRTVVDSQDDFINTCL